MRKVLLILLALTIPATTLRAETSTTCEPGRGIRNITGPEPLTSRLRATADKRGITFEKGTFDLEDFSYLGVVSNSNGAKWHIAAIMTTWGASCRGTRRLLIFSGSGEYLGQYGLISSTKVHIVGNTVHFDDIDPRDGAVIAFGDDGPPAVAWIDGDNLELTK